MIGTIAYHAVDFASTPDLLFDVVEAVRPVTGGRGFSAYKTILAGAESQSRSRRLSEETLRQLSTDLQGRVFSAVQFDVHKDARPDEAITLDLWVAKRAPGVRAGSCEFSVKLIAPRHVALIPAFVVASQRVFELVQAPYGLVYPGKNYNDVLMELTSIPSRVLGQPLTATEELRLKWLGFWQRYEDLIGEYIRTAYWGNFLGRSLVSRLGGLATVLNNAPAAVARSIQGGGVYLQACKGLPGEADCDANLEKLRSYLWPISIVSHHPEAAPSVAT